MIITKGLLTHNEIYFASPKDFNDPFDCRITERYIGRSEEELKKYKREFAEVHKDDNELKGLTFEEIIKKLDHVSKDIEAFQKRSEETHFKMQDEWYGVLSLSETWDNILMWSHYSNNHKGFCVGINGESLLAFANYSSSKGGKVFYEKEYPDLDLRVSRNMNQMEIVKRAFDETHTKAKAWCYEKEYRITKNFMGENPIQRIDSLPANSIVEIILGIAIDEIDKEEILKVARQKGIKVFQAQKIPFKFEIKREQII